MGEPLVTVCVVTYNQQYYIRECLQSLVDQITEFEFIVLVADDYSTDGTRIIISEFAERYPTIIRPVFRERNIGPFANFLRVHEMPRSKYIAHMDGDDYVLPQKLQKQVEFLEANAHCSVVTHRMQTVSEDGRSLMGFKPAGSHSTFTDLEGLLREHTFFEHSSKMYRRMANAYDHSSLEGTIDFFMHVEHASQGLIGYLPDVLGVHRANCGGITAGTGVKLYRLIDLTLTAFERARELGASDVVVNKSKARYLIGAAALCLARGDVAGYRRYLTCSRINNRYVSVWHALLYLLRRNSYVIHCLFRARSWIVAWQRKEKFK